MAHEPATDDVRALLQPSQEEADRRAQDWARFERGEEIGDVRAAFRCFEQIAAGAARAGELTYTPCSKVALRAKHELCHDGALSAKQCKICPTRRTFNAALEQPWADRVRARCSQRVLSAFGDG